MRNGCLLELRYAWMDHVGRKLRQPKYCLGKMENPPQWCPASSQDILGRTGQNGQPRARCLVSQSIRCRPGVDRFPDEALTLAGRNSAGSAHQFRYAFAMYSESSLFLLVLAVLLLLVMLCTITVNRRRDRQAFLPVSALLLPS